MSRPKDVSERAWAFACELYDDFSPAPRQHIARAFDAATKDQVDALEFYADYRIYPGHGFSDRGQRARTALEFKP